MEIENLPEKKNEKNYNIINRIPNQNLKKKKTSIKTIITTRKIKHFIKINFGSQISSFAR